MQFDLSFFQKFFGNKYVQLVFILVGLSLVLFVSWKISTALNNYQSSVVPDMNSETKGSANSQNIKVEPIEIDESSTPRETERSNQYSELKAMLPVTQDGFSITYSYATDRFQVQIAQGQELQFQAWLQQNFNLLQLADFEINSR